MPSTIWKIIWFTILFRQFTYGCNVEDLRKNSQILFGLDQKDSFIASSSALNVKCINDINEIVDAKVKCSKHNKWELPPTCSKTCSPLTVPKDMKVEYSSNSEPYSTGSTAKFSCTSAGLFLPGSDTLTCTSSGTWSNPVPQCVNYVELFINPGGNVTLTCKTSAISNRCHLVNWFFEHEVIHPHSKNSYNLIVYRNTLQITRVNEISIGRYACTCFNLGRESATKMTFDVNLLTTEKRHHNSLLILSHKNGGGGSHHKRNHEKQLKRSRKVKLKYRPKQKNSKLEMNT